jgi:perosamine synthetase
MYSVEESSIPQMEPWMGDEERAAVDNYMTSGGWITEFQNTAKFEELVATYCGAKHAIAVNNGTISLTLAAFALGIGPGDEVIVPNFTMIATPNSVKMLGAVPVFVDVEPETLCMDVTQVAAKISRRTKAVFYVDINGRYPRAGIEPLMRLCQDRGIAFVEDAAQALGSRFPDGQHMGTKGIIGSLSFSTPKIITTGQGGMLLTNDDNMATKLRQLKDFGRTRGGTDVHGTIGFNCKFTELQACIGIAQMNKLPSRVIKKKQIWDWYRTGLSNVPEVRLLSMDTTHCVPWFYEIWTEDRTALQAYLKSRGIGTRVMYPPINEQECYKIKGEFPVSRDIGGHGLWLPSATQLDQAQVSRVCSAVKDFFS